MGALPKIQYREHTKTGMTGKEQTKLLKTLQLIPKNKSMEEQITLMKYLYVFTSGLAIGIFSQII
jgi:hypothetical protein